MKTRDKRQYLSSKNVISFPKRQANYNGYYSSRRKQPVNDAKLMSEIREYVLRISDESIRKNMLSCWRENALKVGVSKFTP